MNKNKFKFNRIKIKFKCVLNLKDEENGNCE